MKGSLKERFDAKYRIDQISGCWLWIASRHRLGYGNIGVRPSISAPAHRVSWELHVGPIPNGLHVLHKCDVRNCVNPGHLYLGTHQDNMRDRNSRNRCGTSKGEKNGSAKLAEWQVREIRSAEDKSPTALARKYQVSPSTIAWILSGNTWKHVA